MKKIMKGLFLAGISILFTQACLADGGRTKLEGPGDAEVIAGTGYEHTLFDSAEQKCQHCHNDLYDTWKTSMHAKSWKDPIFQSKYQDFLRLQASKIGAVGPTGEYKEGTIQKSGQVCIKCHAPTAFYSSDYKITLTQVGDMNLDDDELEPGVPNLSYDQAKSLQSNLAGKPGYSADNETTVTSLGKNGKVYTVSYHIGNSHNREGINCAYCHSVETVRMMNDTDGDLGQYTLKGPIKMGPIGPIVRNPGDTLYYSPDASTLDMNAFFALIGPEKYIDAGDTPKEAAEYDITKAADGRYTMKSVETCEKNDADGECEGKTGYYTGGPYYGPFGVTGLSNSRNDDISDRAALVKGDFQDAVDADGGDKFESKHQFAAYGKSLCLSCHQRSSLMLNPESNSLAGVQPKATVDEDGNPVAPDQFLELCSTWTAMSDGVGNNYEDTETSPKCQRCHMEPLTQKDGEDVTLLHQWDQPDKLFTLADNPGLTEHFLPPSDGGTVGPVAEGYFNNHAFMGANKADFGLTKIKTGFESGMDVVEANNKKLKIQTYLQNKTAHMFPGAHPMRRVLTRMIVTDANGNKVPFQKAKGKSKFGNVTNQVATLSGSTIMEGFETVEVKYDKDGEVVIQGMTPDLDSKKGEPVSSQMMDQAKVDWVSPDATVTNSSAVCLVTDPDTDECKSWGVKGKAQVSKITDIGGSADNFTRIYGRETGKRMSDGTHVVRPGFDSNIATDNRFKPNEREQYTVTYETKGVARPLTVKYKVYYMKKGASGKFPTEADGFLIKPNTPEKVAKLKKLAIYEVYSKEEIVE